MQEQTQVLQSPLAMDVLIESLKNSGNRFAELFEGTSCFEIIPLPG